MIIEVTVLHETKDGIDTYTEITLGVHTIVSVTDHFYDKHKEVSAVIASNGIETRDEKIRAMYFLVKETRKEINQKIEQASFDTIKRLHDITNGVTWTDRKEKPDHLHVVDEGGEA